MPPTIPKLYQLNEIIREWVRENYPIRQTMHHEYEDVVISGDMLIIREYRHGDIDNIANIITIFNDWNWSLVTLPSHKWHKVLNVYDPQFFNKLKKFIDRILKSKSK